MEDKRIRYSIFLVTLALVFVILVPLRSTAMPMDFSALGGGVNGLVRHVSAYGDVLYIGGDFTEAGGEPAYHLAKFSNGQWSSLGATEADFQIITALAVDASNGNLYIGQNFEPAPSIYDFWKLNRWDGQQFVEIGKGKGQISEIAIAPNGDVYVTGHIDSVTGETGAFNHIARWDGSAWTKLGTGLNDDGLALAINQSGLLYVGGRFTSVGGVAVDGLAQWDGANWSPVSSQPTRQCIVKDILVSGNDLYIARNCIDSNQKMIHWDGLLWIEFGGNGVVPVSNLALDYSGSLYGLGFLSDYAVYLYRWHDETLVFSKLIGTEASVFGLETDTFGNAYLGGNFLTISGNEIAYIAKYTDPLLFPTQTVWAATVNPATPTSSPTPTKTLTKTPTVTPTIQHTIGPVYLPILAKQYPLVTSTPTISSVIEDEPNNIFAEANEVPLLPVKVTGRHDGGAGNGDVFLLNLDAGEILKADLTTENINGLQILIYDSEGRELARDFDAPYSITAFAVSSGSYYLYLFTPGDANNTGAYSVNLSIK